MTRVRDNFEAVRLLAALTVLYGHAYALTGTVSPAVFGSSAQALAVKVFFVVSGFLVSESWRRDPAILRYLSRRSLRIFPGLVTVILISILFVGPLLTDLSIGDYFKSPWTWRYLSNIGLHPSYMLPGVFENNVYPVAVNGSLWSLPVEFAMYLLLPIVALSGHRSSMRIVLGCVALCALSLYVVRIKPEPETVVFYGTNVISALDVAPYFFLGAAWRISRPSRLLNPQVAVFVLLLAALVPVNRIAQEITLYIILPYSVLSFATARPALFGAAGRFGDFSYGIYVYGFLIEQAISHYLKTDGRPLLNFGLSLFPTLVLAAASWNFVEKPFLKLKPHSGRSTNATGNRKQSAIAVTD
ncbi:acyltransferase family protein [Paraburkholderia terricola]|uniref:acyltransferase family protein n=1 Tax=Paraburkholderia terricola TaxID=169427 RepID=UPI00285D3008|nr:acyltransferase [Paraburkholderia terricola]MDR6481600.1 peptidoglycan/LPS O-acetylase OafA/YrhL [Paraburkholderia terricola]